MMQLAAHARAERDMREKHWPRQVRQQQMTAAEAQTDLAAWRAIVELLETGSLDIGDPAVPLWPDLVAAARKAEARRQEQATAEPTDARERHAALTIAIRRTLERSAWAAGQCLTPLSTLRNFERLAA